MHGKENNESVKIEYPNELMALLPQHTYYIREKQTFKLLVIYANIKENSITVAFRLMAFCTKPLHHG